MDTDSLQGQFGVAIDQSVIGGQRLAVPPVAFQAARVDGILAPNAAAFDNAPAGGLEARVELLGAGFG